METLNILGLILGSAIRKETVDESLFGESFNLKEAVKIARSHSISSLFASALEKTSYFESLSPDIQKAISGLKMSSTKKSLCFDAESDSLYAKFDEVEIDYLPLKGIIIKPLYPEYGTREFADHDILIRKKDARKVKKVFLDMGYEVESFGKSNHDVYQKQPFFNYEMHTSLFGEAHGPILSKYFRNAWDRAKPISKHRYEFEVNDCYIYILAHSYKHLENSGNGLRYLLDLYILEREWGPSLNRDYFNAQLEALRMTDFYHNSITLASKFLGSDMEPMSEEEKKLFDLIFFSGTYGTMQTRVEHGVEKSSRFKYFMKRAFIPWNELKTYHPFIAYSIILIPFFYAWRLIHALLFKRDKVKAEINAIKNTKN